MIFGEQHGFASAAEGSSGNARNTGRGRGLGKLVTVGGPLALVASGKYQRI